MTAVKRFHPSQPDTKTVTQGWERAVHCQLGWCHDQALSCWIRCEAHARAGQKITKSPCDEELDDRKSSEGPSLSFSSLAPISPPQEKTTNYITV